MELMRRAWGEILVTSTRLFLLGETLGISWPLEVISLVHFFSFWPPFGRSHSLSDSIPGAFIEMPCGLGWVHNTNVSEAATFPDFTACNQEGRQLAARQSRKRRRKTKRSKWANTGVQANLYSNNTAFSQRSRKLTFPENWLHSIKLLWPFPSPRFAHHFQSCTSHWPFNNQLRSSLPFEPSPLPVSSLLPWVSSCLLMPTLPAHNSIIWDIVVYSDDCLYVCLPYQMVTL